MATAMGGDVVMKLLQEFREMQDEAEVRYARTDRVLEQVTQQSQVLFQNTRILFERTRVLFENVEVLTTQVSALAQELGGIKTTHGRMFEQVGRTLNRLAEAQTSDRQRIDTLELHVDGAGKP